MSAKTNRQTKPASPFIISQLPRGDATVVEQGLRITYLLVQILGALPDKQEEQLLVVALDGLPLPLLRRLDREIIEQTKTLGWRIVCSELVLARFEYWERSHPQGAELFEEFGSALSKNARILQQKRLPPIDPKMKDYKRETVAELKQVLNRLRTPDARKERSKKLKAVSTQFREAVVANNSVWLACNLDSWIAYLDAQQAEVGQLLLKPRCSPATLFDQWLAGTTGHGIEALRQKVSSGTCK